MSRCHGSRIRLIWYRRPTPPKCAILPIGELPRWDWSWVGIWRKIASIIGSINSLILSIWLSRGIDFGAASRKRFTPPRFCATTAFKNKESKRSSNRINFASPSSYEVVRLRLSTLLINKSYRGGMATELLTCRGALTCMLFRRTGTSSASTGLPSTNRNQMTHPEVSNAAP